MTPSRWGQILTSVVFSSTARPVTSEDNINPMMDRLGPEIDFGYEIHFPDQWVNFGKQM